VREHVSRAAAEEARTDPTRRRGFRVARALLLVMATVAVFAPWIANDEAYVLVAVDRGAYASAHRTLTPITRAIVEATASADLETVEVEAVAARLRVVTLERYLARTLREPCLDYRASLDALVRTLRRGKDASMPASGLEQALSRIRAELGPEQVELAREGFVPAVSFPLLRTLSMTEVLLSIVWSALLVFGTRSRWSARRRLIWITVGVLLGTTVAVGWRVTRIEQPVLTTSGTKRGLTEGEIDASFVLFPPLAMGYAETHLDESFRPPTWTRASRMTEGGRYVSGARAHQADATGFVPPATPVEVRRAEPGLNAATRHLFGTDGAGRDVLARVVWGGRASLAVGFLSAVLLTLLGTAVGAVAGTFGGRVDFVLSRTIEIVIAFPAFFLVLVVMALVDPDVVPPVLGLVAVIALVGWTGVARLVRAEFLRLREADFVLAARALGFSTTRIVFVHMLPSALGPVLVAFAFAFASGIFVESTISFLGFGIDRPTPSWGALIAESSSPRTWWLQLFPGLAILVTVVCVHVVGEGWRGAYDPRGRDEARELRAGT